MSDSSLITAVIPAFNPRRDLLLEAISSVEGQTHRSWEIVLVDDGTDSGEGREAIADLERRGDDRIRIVRQSNLGLAAARNAGFREARGRFVVPLDADDRIEPEMMAATLAELEAHPEAAFAYADYRVFGDSDYVQQTGPYNLYRLLERNFLTYCMLLRKTAWEQAGGYPEEMRQGYEDWAFAIKMGLRGHYGRYLPRTLFRYRRQGPSLYTLALERHDANLALMRRLLPEALEPKGRLEIKRRWAPSICVVASGVRTPDLSTQTLRDYQLVRATTDAEALEQSRAEAFLWLEGGGRLGPAALEECVWGLQESDWVTWRDTGDAPPPTLRTFAGPLGVSRRAMAWPDPKQGGEVRRLPWRCLIAANLAGADEEVPVEPPPPAECAPSPRRLPGIAIHILRHLQNAELLSWRAWLRHPLRSAVRLIPLRVKETVNELAGRPLFDLSFYLRFQPRSVLSAAGVVEALDYVVAPPPEGKQRLLLVTPHLGVGGAEAVLLELASQIHRERCEVILAASFSRDGRWRRRWEALVDHIVDVDKLVGPKQTTRLLFSLALNWKVDALLLQNAPAAYAVAPALKQKMPHLAIADLLHAVDDDWDFFSATLDVADSLDHRVVISEQGRRRLEQMDIPAERVRLIRNGVDPDRFDPARVERGRLRSRLRIDPSTLLIGYLGRLDKVKGPQLLPRMAAELRRLRPQLDFRLALAGSGPLDEELRAKARRAGLAERFRLLGHLEDPAEFLADVDVLVIPSEGEGVPLALLEALSMETAVVALRAGALEEALPQSCGVIVEGGFDADMRLAQTLAGLSDDPSRLEEFGKHGRERVLARYHVVRAREQYRKLIEELLAQPSHEA